MNEIFFAIAYFHADPSVGIFSYSFKAEIPKPDDEYREFTRDLLKKAYQEMDGEFSCTVFFSDETS